MPTLALLNWAALLASLTMLGVAFALLPDLTLWTGSMLFALALFVLAVAFLFISPSLIAARRGRDDAESMAAIGPVGGIAAVLLLLTALALTLAAFGFDRMALVLDILALGGLAIALLSLRALKNRLVNAAAGSAQPGKLRQWQGQVQVLCGMTADATQRALLEKLAEKLRYAGSDVSGGSPQDAEIDAALKEIGTMLTAETLGLEAVVGELETALLKREVFLRALRSK